MVSARKPQEGKQYHKNYRIELSLPQTASLGALFILSLALCFYLGWVSGYGTYIPETMPALAAQTTPSSDTASTEATTNTSEELNFYDLGDKPEAIEKTLAQFESIKKRTEKIRNQRSQRQATPPQVSVVSPSPALPEIPITKQALSQRRTINTEGRFTVQLFSSQSREGAEDFLALLRAQGIKDGFIHTFINAQNNTLYRVRVGRSNRESAEATATRLKQLNFVSAAQVTPY